MTGYSYTPLIVTLLAIPKGVTVSEEFCIYIPQSDEVGLRVVPRVAPGLRMMRRRREQRGQEEERGGRDGRDDVGHPEALHKAAGEHHSHPEHSPELAHLVHSTPVQ